MWPWIEWRGTRARVTHVRRAHVHARIRRSTGAAATPLGRTEESDPSLSNPCASCSVSLSPALIHPYYASRSIAPSPRSAQPYPPFHARACFPSTRWRLNASSCSPFTPLSVCVRVCVVCVCVSSFSRHTDRAYHYTTVLTPSILPLSSTRSSPTQRERNRCIRATRIRVFVHVYVRDAFVTASDAEQGHTARARRRQRRERDGKGARR